MMNSVATDLAFVGAILLVALCAWLVRSLVEGNPDPFYLNLTFFAFAGHTILLVEIIASTRLSLGAFLLFLTTTALAVLQIYIMRSHRHITEAHYRSVLRSYQPDSISDSDADHWAKLLLHITGTDFCPGSYEWLSSLFTAEPRAKRRREAHSILPPTRFLVSTPNGLTPEELTVPADEGSRRRTLWRLYVATCVLTWISFILAMFVGRSSSG